MFNLMLTLFVRYIVVNSLCSFLFCGGGVLLPLVTAAISLGSVTEFS